MTPYRDPSWPHRKPIPKPRRFEPTRALPASVSLLLTVTTYQLVLELYALHFLLLAIRLGLPIANADVCQFLKCWL